MYKNIKNLVMEKKFSQAIDILLLNYGKVSYNERLELNIAIDALSYFKAYEHQFPKQAIDIYYIWKDFDQYLLEKHIYKHIPIIDILAKSIMAEIFNQYSMSSLQPKNKTGIHESIMYANSMIWLGEIKNAATLLLSLLQETQLEAEVWSLCGKLYDIIGNKQKSQLFYREAFFINPSVLNLIDIRHHLIESIIDYFLVDLKAIASLERKDYLLEWLGITGIVGNFFNIRQEFSYGEETLLNRRIDVYEGYFLRGTNKKYEDFVKLLRLYLFKLDYFRAKQDSEKTQEMLKKIELLSPLIYNKI